MANKARRGRRERQGSDEEYRRLRRIALGLDAAGGSADNPNSSGPPQQDDAPEVTDQQTPGPGDEPDEE